MITWLKKHFIPHYENEYQPHFLRERSLQIIVILVLIFELIAFILPTLTFVARVKKYDLATVLPGVLTLLTNEEREENKLNVLTVNPLLTKAAQLKAEDMATKGYFAHTSPEGLTPWHWLDTVGYSYLYAGENLAVNFTDSKDVTEAWMLSPTHRANIVKEKYTEVGTGVATGMYQGRQAVFVAQEYGSPRPLDSTSLALNTTPIANSETPVSTSSLALSGSTTAQVLGAQIEPPQEVVQEVAQEVSSEVSPQVEPSPEPALEKAPTLVQQIEASPRHASNIIFFSVLGILVLALILKIFIYPRIQHVHIITNVLMVIAVIGLIYVINFYISQKNNIQTESMDYSVYDTNS